MRGRHLRGERAQRPGGRIPARAGSTPYCPRTRCSCTEDPRACGVDTSGPVTMTRHGGGSPRVRGRREIAERAERATRRIPARTGSTPCAATATTPAPEDPRACGVDGADRHRARHPSGRSSRARGRHLPDRHPVVDDRKIPACAGPTPHTSPVSRRTTEDPRVRGADGGGVRYAPGLGGGSPRARGRQYE